MSKLSYLGPVAVVLGVVYLTSAAMRTPVRELPPSVESTDDLPAAVARIDAHQRSIWEREGLVPAEPADDLTILRRLSLALHGVIPSIEEIRLFEADGRRERLRHWTEQMLQDPRFADYFAERLARGYVGVEQGQFLVFRRDRFLHWLSGRLQDGVPYDRIVRELIIGEGVWTGQGEANFLTSGFADGEFDANKLTARTVRAFLGQRIDCAQCHDHPFDDWKQSEFEGLAAHFGQVEIHPLAGVYDNPQAKFEVEDRITLEMRQVEPAVPFHPEWQGDANGRRQRLANWITHAENRRFERAIANRVWGLMFGVPYAMDRPVDDLPDPDPANEDMLDLLGADFRGHGCDVRRLIRVITASAAFRLESRHPLDEVDEPADGSSSDAAQSGQLLARTRDNWGVFPLIRLRPEQVIGAMLQANNIHTVDQNSHLITRTMKFLRQRDFIDEFGDPGVEELQERTGTIPQALLRMNGRFAGELTEANPFNSPGRISFSAGTSERLVETVFLACLTRRPDAEELAYFAKWFPPGEDRKSGTEDLYWTLFNSPEFSWNH